MNQSRTSASPIEPQIVAARDAFDRLTFLGWRTGLAAITAGLAVSFFLYGYALIYWRNADMDFMVIYNALALNDGRPQLFFDHTAYLTILSLKSWFGLLHGLGLLGKRVGGFKVQRIKLLRPAFCDQQRQRLANWSTQPCNEV